MEHLTEPTLWVFLLQAVGLPFYIPLTYLAYRWVRAPLKRDRVKQSLSQLGVVQTKDWRKQWPLSIACGIMSGHCSLHI